MPERNIPPDWYLTLFGLFWTGLAGSLGAVLRQITGPKQSWLKRLSEWIGGAICAVYMTPTVTHISLHLLNKFDLIEQGAILSPESITGLAGLMCGALGITLIESLVIIIKHFRRKITS
ncbi:MULTISPECIES: hypothetical protein [unclassified Bartonella]|uniref:hypothetical protein n=1 Tax=unclassified Bartonella TaxID=2645622 RepID=UPI0015FCADC0|nr:MULTISPECIES: hypothetical protein [unclassified Bartonella]UXN03109.1 hypothetical protein N6B01_11685 [Bartonella sp. HY406]